MVTADDGVVRDLDWQRVEGLAAQLADELRERGYVGARVGDVTVVGIGQFNQR